MFWEPLPMWNLFIFIDFLGDIDMRDWWVCHFVTCNSELLSVSLTLPAIQMCILYDVGLGEKYLRPPVFSDVVKANPTQEEVLKVVVTRNQRPAIPNTWVICFPEVRS